MTKYIIRDGEAGNEITYFFNRVDAERMLEAYEEEDRADGTYTPDFYKIVEVIE